MTGPNGERGPALTVDLIISSPDRPDSVVLIERKYEPHGWALPGGFVDYGETVESAAIREAKEETGLDVELVRQFHVYSDPARDRRKHTASVVFIARARSEPVAADDAAGAGVFTRDTLPRPMAFDHGQILADYFAKKY